MQPHGASCRLFPAPSVTSCSPFSHARRTIYKKSLREPHVPLPCSPVPWSWLPWVPQIGICSLWLPSPCCSGNPVLGRGCHGAGSGSDSIMSRLRALAVPPTGAQDDHFHVAGVYHGTERHRCSLPLRWRPGKRWGGDRASPGDFVAGLPPPPALAGMGGSVPASLPGYPCGGGGGGLADGAVAA